jgi:DsbC/DsbD-like thiol-disulfide interchange protein
VVTTSSAGRAAAGATLSLSIDIAPKPKMHVYAPGEKDGIPVTLTIEPNPAIKVGAPVFPPPQKYYFEPLKLTQLVYSKPFTIVQPVTLAAASSGDRELTIEGSLRYQACDDRVCYLPKRVPLSWKVSIAE